MLKVCVFILPLFFFFGLSIFFVVVKTVEIYFDIHCYK